MGIGFDSWWKRILAGDTTAIPYEWLTPEGDLRLAGESAAEFIAILEEYGIEPNTEMRTACREYAARAAIEKSGQHPNGLTPEDWNIVYED